MADMARRQGLLNSASNHLNRGSSRSASSGAGRVGKTLGALYLSQLIPALLLVVYGVVVIWSASLTIPEANFPRHLVGIAMGLVGAVLIWRNDYRNLQGMTRVLFVVACVLMIAPKIPGLSYSAKGITGWVKVPGIGITFQPSELAKLVVIHLMASLGAQYNGKIESLRDYVRLCAVDPAPARPWHRPRRPGLWGNHHHLLGGKAKLGACDHCAHCCRRHGNHSDVNARWLPAPFEDVSA